MNPLSALLRHAGAAVVALGVVGTCFYWSVIDDEKPALHLDAYAAQDTAVPGGALTVAYTVVRAPRNDCSAEIVTELQDASGQRFSPPVLRYGNAKRRTVVDVPDTVENRVRIPYEISLGPLLYRNEIRYACNPWHRFVAPLITVYEVCVPVGLVSDGCDPKAPAAITGTGRMYQWAGKWDGR